MESPVAILFFGYLDGVIFLNHHLEPGDSLLSVCILAALLRTNHGLSCGRIDRTNSRFHFIDILTAFSAASEGIEYDQLGVKFFGFNCCTNAEIDKPIFSLVLWAIWAAANPLYRADEAGEIAIRTDSYRAISPFVEPWRRTDN